MRGWGLGLDRYAYTSTVYVHMYMWTDIMSDSCSGGTPVSHWMTPPVADCERTTAMSGMYINLGGQVVSLYTGLAVHCIKG